MITNIDCLFFLLQVKRSDGEKMFSKHIISKKENPECAECVRLNLLRPKKIKYKPIYQNQEVEAYDYVLTKLGESLLYEIQYFLKSHFSRILNSPANEIK